MKFIIPFLFLVFSKASAQTTLPVNIFNEVYPFLKRAADSCYYHGKYAYASKIYQVLSGFNPTDDYLKFRIEQSHYAHYNALTREKISYRHSLGLAKFKYGVKKYMEARKYLNHARQLNPTNTEAYLLNRRLDSVLELPATRKKIYDQMIAATDTLLLFQRNDQRVIEIFNEIEEFEADFPNNTVQQPGQRIDSLKKVYPRLIPEILLYEGLKLIENGKLDLAELKFIQFMEIGDSVEGKFYLDFLNRRREFRNAQKNAIEKNLACFEDCLRRKDVVQARECYLNLRYLTYTNKSIEQQMNEMVRMVDDWRVNDPEAFYKLLIEEGDYANIHHELLGAKEFYQQARNLKPEDSYPALQIAEIDYFLSVKK